jgi:hypothetical protein
MSLQEKIETRLAERLAEQKESILKSEFAMSLRIEVENFIEEEVFCEEDWVDILMEEMCDDESNVSVEDLRDMQHLMVRDLLEHILDGVSNERR